MVADNPSVDDIVQDGEEGDMESVDLNVPDENVASTHQNLDEDKQGTSSANKDSSTSLENPKLENLTDQNFNEAENDYATESLEVHDSSESSNALPPGITILNSTEEDDIQKFPSLPVIPVDPQNDTRKRRHTRLAPSLALSISSITNTGQQTVSSSVFIKKAMQTISKHKVTAKNPVLKTSVTNALSTYSFVVFIVMLF